MHIMAVDIGNSSTKWGIVDSRDGERFIKVGCIVAEDPLEIDISRFRSVGRTHWFLSSVDPQRLQQLVSSGSMADDESHLLSYEDFPLTVDVDFPQQVGIDRLAGAVAAYKRRKGQGGVIVVDVGTAVTVDRVSEKGEFQGGAIFPGIASQLKTLSQSTAQLPDLSKMKRLPETDALGKNTEQAIINGVAISLMGGIKEIVARLSCSGEQYEVFITGRGIAAIGELLPSDFMVIEDLVLQGIASVALHGDYPNI